MGRVGQIEREMYIYIYDVLGGSKLDKDGRQAVQGAYYLANVVVS